MLILSVKKRTEKSAKSNSLEIKILPRIGISEDRNSTPTKIWAYQMM